MTIHFSLQDFNQHTKLGTIDSEQLHQYLANTNAIQSVILGQDNSIYCRIDPAAKVAIHEINTQLEHVSKTGRIFYANEISDGQIQIKSRFPTKGSSDADSIYSSTYDFDEEFHPHGYFSSTQALAPRAPTPIAQPVEIKPITVEHTLEFPKATAEELQTQGQLKTLNQGLLTGHLVTSDGRCVYMARQKSYSKETDAQNYIEALSTYFKQAMVAISPYEKPNPGFHQGIQLEPYLAHLKDKGEQSSHNKHYNTLKQAKYALTGEMLTSDDFRHTQYFYDKKHVYYVSTQPITEANFKHDMSFNTLRDFHTNASHIAMVITSASNKERTILRGVCKTPAAIFNNLTASFNRNNQKIGLAVALQHFGVACSKHEGLKFSTFSPMPHMTTLFTNQLQTEKTQGLYIGHESIKENGLKTQLGPTKENETPIVIKNEEYENPLWP